MKSNLRHVAPAALLIISLASALAGCGHASATADGATAPMFTEHAGRWNVPAQSPLRQRLSVEPVREQLMPHRVVVPGMIEAEPTRSVAIVPPLSGRLLALKVSLGERVKQGQLLAVIASGDMDQAQADWLKARDALTLATQARDRAQAVQQAGGAATKDLEAASSAYNQARAEYDRAHDRLSSLGDIDPGKAAGGLALRAPMDGVIATLNVAPGSYLSDATAPIMSIENLDQVWVTAQVAEDQLAQLQVGQAVEVDLAAFPGQPLHGHVAVLEPILQADSRRARAHIVLDNPDGRLRPNMFANVAIEVPQPPALLLPQSALLMNNDSVSVFVEVAPWTFERREVRIGYDEAAATRVLSGLRAGERVITRGGVLLND